ncbi:uncharacterized protein KY384_004908 [Bacidia gigantensis]|uniref:uncharacterized protein n=1 Tax=Bacidia gigantensis TaxID=2732470 RepID=UPI001D049913|nr:uncharacterized protein KY384_004908 [Bacidia gigantensis]KAG8530406.1 hypothetical protein KY384_004908 [Bacidia gigantensis]
MSSTTSSITTNDNFFKAFGTGSTNKRLVDSQQIAKPLQDQSIDRIKTENASFYSVDPSTNPSAFQDPFLTADTSELPTWAREFNPQQPLSPISSDTMSPKNWSFDYQSNVPPNPLINLQSDLSFRTQYGQVTPPDIDDDGIFDRQLQEQLKQQEQGSKKSTSSKESQLSTSSASGNAPTTPAVPKRTRKYTSRNSKQSPPDPNNPGEVRRSKFLERNRIAASKCRQKKKEWTQNLETRARDLQKDNSDLHTMIDSLSQEVFYLKTQCGQHIGCDCSEIQRFMKDPAHDLSSHHQQSWSRHSPVKSFDGHSRAGSIDTSDSSDPLSALTEHDKQLANDDHALEALLKCTIDHDTSEEGIAERVII